MIQEISSSSKCDLGEGAWTSYNSIKALNSNNLNSLLFDVGDVINFELEALEVSNSNFTKVANENYIIIKFVVYKDWIIFDLVVFNNEAS